MHAEVELPAEMMYEVHFRVPNWQKRLSWAANMYLHVNALIMSDKTLSCDYFHVGLK